MHITRKFHFWALLVFGGITLALALPGAYAFADDPENVRVVNKVKAKITNEVTAKIVNSEPIAVTGEVDLKGPVPVTLQTNAAPLGVKVENLPLEQNAYITGGYPSPINDVYAQAFGVPEDETTVVEFGRTIQTTAIVISADPSNDFIINFYSPLIPNIQPVEPVFRVLALRGGIDFKTMSFSFPIPIGGYTIQCRGGGNPGCNLAVSVMGFEDGTL